MVAVVEGANRQEDSTSDVELQSSGCAGDSGLHPDEGVRVNSQGLEGGGAEDVDLGSCVCNSLSIDFGGIFILADFEFE